MKKCTCALLLLASFCASAQSINHSVLQKSLKPWHPIIFSENGGVIRLTMNEDRVSNEIYESVILMGVCTPLWFEAKKTAYLNKIKEIHVLNRNSRSGFIFESPKSSCEEVGKAKGDGGKIVIAAHTHSK
ncbi:MULTISPECIES: hypothetical protein [Dickeya]|uniref:DUF4431 domain-containing protein n=1 Tax=Dickeya oryzae TaxID=1240404 RepID=A0AB39IZ96_9GAMM|nr:MULTISPECIES: hypothetical protein [Dickeya]MBP2846322.1 hypothetical protein [Dickeya oryzae]MCA6992655.1 hypothetical protein [Dickeya oryzae]